MGKSQRTKGAVFEREVAKQFSAAYGEDFLRNIGQARDGGNDIDIGRFRVECKRRKTLGTVEGWLTQATAACGVGHVPIVVARSDGGAAMVLLSLEDFLALTKGGTWQ